MNVQIFDIMPVSWRLYSQIVIFCLLLAMGVYFVANRGKRRLHRLLGGVLLFWSLLHLKDMLLIDNAMPDRYLERLCICIDILAVPTCAFLLFELTAPGWFAWRRALRHELPHILIIHIERLPCNRQSRKSHDIQRSHGKQQVRRADRAYLPALQRLLQQQA